MIIFGGYNNSLCDDTHEYDFINNKWRFLYSTSSIQPRNRHTACLWKDYMVVFGGNIGYNQNLNDVNMFHIGPRNWINATPTHGIAPKERSNSAAVVHNSKMYIFGGGGKEDIIYNDLWEFNLLTFKWKAISQYGDVPQARSGHTCVIFNGSLILYGGHDHKVSKLWLIGKITNLGFTQ